MRVLILKNISHEGPGTIGDFLASASVPFSVVDLSQGQEIPDQSGFDTLIMMGGPMSVHDKGIYHYIDKEFDLARDFVEQGKKVFGVCLGAQIMAKALGAEVYKGTEPETGWYDIELTPEGLKDPLMRELAGTGGAEDVISRFPVFHLHGETFTIPAGAMRLASSDRFPNQAFRFGKNAYAFQFHIEVTKDMVYDWLKNEGVDMVNLKKETEMYFGEYSARALRFYHDFFRHGYENRSRPD